MVFQIISAKKTILAKLLHLLTGFIGEIRDQISIYICIRYNSGHSQSASLLAHERSRFAICQWELSTPTDISIPLTHRLVLRALEAGECLSAFKKNYNSTICFVKKYFAAPTADASFLYEQFFKYETSCSKPLYAITFSPSGII